MKSHEEWFSYLEKSEQRGVVKTGDDTPHPIEHVGKVPLSHVGQKGRLMNVLYIPTVEYKCIMDVFTLSPWTAQVRAIFINSIKGNCPK